MFHCYVLVSWVNVLSRLHNNNHKLICTQLPWVGNTMQILPLARQRPADPSPGAAAFLSSEVQELHGPLLRSTTFLVGSAEGKHCLKTNDSSHLSMTPTNTMSTISATSFLNNAAEIWTKISGKCLLSTLNSMYRFFSPTEFWGPIWLKQATFPTQRWWQQRGWNLALSKVTDGVVCVTWV